MVPEKAAECGKGDIDYNSLDVTLKVRPGVGIHII
jgi:hypothetical protein